MASLNSNEGQLNLKLTFNSDKNITEKIEIFLNEFDDFLIAKGYGDGFTDGALAEKVDAEFERVLKI